MLDPFLYNHFINPRTFSIGGLLSPISIRDQIIRGWMLVDRALEEKLITKDDELPFLIVGAGVSGVTAAMRAAEHEVWTQVVDMRNQTFAVQKGCKSRWICPTQYDWPVDHYREGRYPFNDLPQGEYLRWRADRADRLADEWDAQFHFALEQRYWGLIDYREYTKLIDPAPRLDDRRRESVIIRTAKAELRPDGTPTGKWTPDPPFEARAVLLAFGFGKERNYVGPDDNPRPARGLPFWKNDPIAQVNLGVPNELAHVLITGSGDGALQDFLRTVIDTPNDGQLYAREFYDSLKIPSGVEHELQSIQDHAQRAYAWGAYARHDHQPLSQLHQAYLDRVDRLLRSSSGPAIKRKISRRLRIPFPKVRLVYDCNHFNNCYGLNRFLVLLVARFLEEENRESILFPGYRVVDLICDQPPHTCQEKAYNPKNPSDPDTCHGWWHGVVVQQYEDCRNDPRKPESWGKRIDEFWLANVLILRNGVYQSESEKQLSPPCARHILPYSVYP